MRRFILALWLAFVLRGAFHAVTAPMWDNFDEPGHLAYILFIDDHGRPPGFDEPSFPKFFIEANRYLPSMVGSGAPDFQTWGAMSPAMRDRSRALADQLARDPRRYTLYAGGNYERQQGPVFYYLAAIPAFVLRKLTLPKLVVAMRLFCVLLASLAIPIAAKALDLLGGARVVAIGLPLVALLPNTIFAFDRISNEALVFPLMALIAYGLIAMATRATDRDAWILGIAATIGIWTRLTLVCVLPAVIVALVIARVRRPRAIAAAIGLPIITTLILLAWNKVESGHVTGLIQQTSITAVTRADIGQALARMRSLPLLRELVKNHLWAGGWGFLKPPGFVYAIVVIGIALTLVIATIKGRPKMPRAAWPLAAVIVVYLAAMLFHMITGAIAAIHDPKFPTIGAEGWYLDEMRVMEAGLVAIVLAGAFNARRTSQALIAACVIADIAGTLLLLIPHWGGAEPYAFSAATFAAAIQAAPVRKSIALPILIALGYLTAATAAALRSPASSADSATATP